MNINKPSTVTIKTEEIHYSVRDTNDLHYCIQFPTTRLTWTTSLEEAITVLKIAQQTEPQTSYAIYAQRKVTRHYPMRKILQPMQ